MTVSLQELKLHGRVLDAGHYHIPTLPPYPQMTSGCVHIASIFFRKRSCNKDISDIRCQEGVILIRCLTMVILIIVKGIFYFCLKL